MTSWKNIFWRNINTYTCLIENTLSSKYDWNVVSAGSCVNPKGVKVPGKVLKQNYNTNGKYPIISQSKTFIEGYSDLTEYVINNEDGLVVLGDHTRVLKYVSIPFIVGADGVKVIKPNDEFIPKFLFYLLHSIDIESKDYGRHYKLLRSGNIVEKKDSKDIQKLIVKFLDDLEQNKLSSKIYFDESCEKQILSIQKRSINCFAIHAEITHQQSLLKKLRQSILQDAISGKLTEKWQRENSDVEPATELLARIKAEKERLVKEKKIKKQKQLPLITEAEIPFELPKGWAWCRLGDISEVKVGATPKREIPAY